MASFPFNTSLHTPLHHRQEYYVTPASSDNCFPALIRGPPPLSCATALVVILNEMRNLLFAFVSFCHARFLLLSCPTPIGHPASLVLHSPPLSALPVLRLRSATLRTNGGDNPFTLSVGLLRPESKGKDGNFFRRGKSWEVEAFVAAPSHGAIPRRLRAWLRPGPANPKPSSSFCHSRHE